MRKLIHVFLISVLLLPSPTLAESDYFKDLDEGNPNYTAIMDLVEQGVLEGYDDGTFKAEKEVSRAEAVKIVLLGLGLDLKEVREFNFVDVKDGDWYFDYVKTAYDLGIVQGYENDLFLPNQNVSRAEAVKILFSGAEIEGIDASEYEDLYPDIQPDDWFAPYAILAVKYNIVATQMDGYWYPHEEMSRGEFAEMIYRFQYFMENQEAYDETLTWLETEFPTVDVTLTVPPNWYVKQDGVGAVWLLDVLNNQYSLLTPYDNGATLLMTRYSNSENSDAATLFANIEAQTEATTVESEINGYPTLIIHKDEDIYYREWYVYLDNGRLVHFLALRGKGAYSDALESYLNKIVDSVKYLPTGDTGMTMDEILATLRAAIQVDGVGMEKINLLPDISIIETDTIGIGTGPVDYYYSPTADITIKYERSFDVILDIENGQSTAF